MNKKPMSKNAILSYRSFKAGETSGRKKVLIELKDLLMKSRTIKARNEAVEAIKKMLK